MSDRSRNVTLADLVDAMSPSRSDLWAKCQWAFFARYVLGIRRPPTAAMAWGNAHDGAANAVYVDKLATGATMPVDEAAERYAESWNVARIDVEDWEDADPGTFLDQGVALTREWHKRAATKVEPVSVQVRVERAIHEPDGSTWTLLGYVDLIGDVPTAGGGTRRVVIDHKASGRYWTAADVIRSSQGPAYSIGTGVEPFSLHVGTRRGKSKSVAWKSLTLTIGQTDRDGWLIRTSIARRQIAAAYRTGDFLPNRGHMLCSRRWCGFWRECERANGGRVAP